MKPVEEMNLWPINGMSHVRGDRSEPVWNITIPKAVRRTVSECPTGLAAVFNSRNVRWTYKEFATQVDRLASGLLSLGLKRGDRVGVWSPNCPEWVLLQFATARIGLILVTINPAYRPREAEYALRRVGVKLLLVAERFKSSCYIAMLREMAPEIQTTPRRRLEISRLPKLRHCVHTGAASIDGMYSFGEIMARSGKEIEGELDRMSDALDPDDAINIQFTSGTTGAPKGATLTHKNIVNNARFVAATLKFGPADRLCIPVPLYHCFGMVMGSLACMTTASTMVFPSDSFDARSTVEALQQERCTALYGVPTMFVAMLDELASQPRDISSLRTGIMAGAPCPMEIMRRVIDVMNLREITIAYGMTETSPVSFQSHVDDSLERRVGTVGRIHPQVEVKIVDRAGQVVPTGEQGEICTRGYSVMKGYWDDPATTAKCIDDEGWMHTGDLGILDSDGYCRIAGRITDMVIRGGENIYPREIEEFIYRHPQVQVVQVFGVPDETMGEEVCAWIIATPNSTVTAAEIREHCREGMAHFKIPKHVRFTHEMPMTVTGKPQKFKMRAAMIEELKGKTKSRN
ncbi:MAG: AMP-binding protein [Rhodobacteraceae bacterium]|nr:AMP-binding protein [Paracoccaceae bacterium]